MGRNAKAIAAISALLLLTCGLWAMSATAAAPIVSMGSVSAVGYTSAHVTGTVDPEDNETYYSFEYTSDPKAGWSGFNFEGPLAAGVGPTNVEADLSNLIPGTEYFVRLVAWNFVDSQVHSQTVQTFQTDQVAPPTVSISAPSQITDSSVHFEGEINPGGTDPLYDISWHFQCNPACPGLSGTIPADNSSHMVEADASGLRPGRGYEVSLVAQSLGAEASAGPESFTTDSRAAQVLSTVAFALRTEATLRGQIDPGGLTTAYHFEYGPTNAYGQSTPSKDLPAGADPTNVKADLLGLSPGAGYHFKLVTENADGADESSDRAFATLAAEAPAGGCPNELVRKREGATQLPECRAYEMVSPVAKGGNGVTGFYTVQASPDGERVAYASTGPFPGSVSTSTMNSYLAQRTGAGWATRPLAPAQLNQGQVLTGPARDFSVDLQTGIAFSRRALAPGATEGDANIYRQDNLTGDLSYIGGSPSVPFFEFATGVGQQAIWGGSDDYDHVLLSGFPVKLTEDSPEGAESVYDLTGSGIKLVSILPNGVPAAQARVGSGLPPSAEDHVISADGRHIFFSSGDRLYERRDGTETIEISASELPVEEGPPIAVFGAATPDGADVFFVAHARLTAEGPPNSEFLSPRLYRYAEGHLELIGENHDGGLYALEVLGVSNDGSVAYFSSGKPTSIYRWALGEGVHKVASLEALPSGVADDPATWRMSPDGRYAAFEVYSRLTPDSLPGPECPEQGEYCRQVYVYDALNDELQCASCSPDGEAPTGSSSIDELFNQAGPPRTFSRYAARGITNQGRLYFNSPTRLTQGDADSKLDVYAWENGVRALLTPGTETDTVYADSSSDGSTVYILTADRLVGQDVDGDRDLYAVRREGGFLDQNPQPGTLPCLAESCQGSAFPPPASVAPASREYLSNGRKPAKRRPALTGARRAVVNGPRGKMTVAVSGPGRVTLEGDGLRPVRRHVQGAGTVRLQLVLDRASRSRLLEAGRIEVNGRVVFDSGGGTRQSRRILLTFVSGRDR